MYLEESEYQIQEWRSKIAQNERKISILVITKNSRGVGKMDLWFRFITSRLRLKICINISNMSFCVDGQNARLDSMRNYSATEEGEVSAILSSGLEHRHKNFFS